MAKVWPYLAVPNQYRLVSSFYFYKFAGLDQTNRIGPRWNDTYISTKSRVTKEYFKALQIGLCQFEK